MWRAEMIVAAFNGLVLNICWAPVIDAIITAGKYVCTLATLKPYFILSLVYAAAIFKQFFMEPSILHRGRLKMILTSFIITFLVNVAGRYCVDSLF